VSVFRIAPTYSEPLVTGKNTSSSWYRWFQSLDKGIPPSSEVAVLLGASPFTYAAPSKGFAIVSGGTVSAIAFSRTAGTFYGTGQTTGTFPLSAQDSLKITYSVAPTVIFVAQ
jgi:hypothetical protein